MSVLLVLLFSLVGLCICDGCAGRAGSGWMWGWGWTGWVGLGRVGRLGWRIVLCRSSCRILVLG